MTRPYRGRPDATRGIADTRVTGPPGSSAPDRTGAGSTTPVATDQAVAMSTAPHRGDRRSRAPSSTTSPTPSPAGRTSGAATPPTSAPSGARAVPGPGFAPAQLRFANGARVEVLMPWDTEVNDFLSRFLAANGPGPHHLTFKVPDLADAIDRARAYGIEPVGIDLSHPEWLEAFLHPKVATGVVVQLAEEHQSWSSPAPDDYPTDRRLRSDGSGRGAACRPPPCLPRGGRPRRAPRPLRRASCPAGRSARERPTGCAGSTWPGPGRWASGWSVPMATPRPARSPSGWPVGRGGSTTWPSRSRSRPACRGPCPPPRPIARLEGGDGTPTLGDRPASDNAGLGLVLVPTGAGHGATPADR